MSDTVTPASEVTLGRRDALLYSISAILLLDTVASSAAIGVASIGWWLVLGALFFVPFALISTELGCSYPDPGGIYGWVRRAFGGRWAGRIAWYYWVNVAAWCPSIYVLLVGVLSQWLSLEISLLAQVGIGLVLAWLTVLVNWLTLDLGKWVPNVGALFKIVIFSAIILGAFALAAEQGTANAFSLAALVPRWEQGVQYVPVIVYGMLGFELISASSDALDDPAAVLPGATLAAGAIILLFYVLSTVAVLVAIPVAEVNLVEGLVDTLRLLFAGDLTSWLVHVLIAGALYTFFSNGVTWALGANRAAAAAARSDHLPSVFGREDRQRGTPVGAAVLLGVASSAILLLYALTASNNEDLFWSLFAFSGVIFFLPYVVMMLAYVRLKRRPDYPARFRFAPPAVTTVLAWLCAGILLFCIGLFLYVPGEGLQWPVLTGAAVLIVLGEFVIPRQVRHG
ncbi:MAG: APC family permease [Pseudomonadota bacterium]